MCDPQTRRTAGHAPVSERDQPAGDIFDLGEGRESAGASPCRIEGTEAEVACTQLRHGAVSIVR